ncbi:MAG: hypothetical protein AAF372_03140 [Pseudomonadota bacterium]
MLKLISFLSLLLYSINLWASCDPDTVNFYLDKGFTPDQVTELCTQGAAESSTPSYEPYQKPVVIYQQGAIAGVSADESNAINDLKSAIAARSVDITDDKINYIRSVCLRAGTSPNKEERVVDCTDVAFSVSRDGLRADASGKRLLVFGEERVFISSDEIIRKPLVADPWEGYPPDLKFLLERKYESQESGNTSYLPVKKGYSTDQVVEAIRALSAITLIKQDETYDSEVEKVLSETYVPPTKEEYIANNPTYEEIQEEEEGGRWWNPFD